ncbi:hypothetical protein [Thiomicrorhabdus cannonii]|uniref:hypothetical protein n=1 Tax=Thiomicrorhabdus cannonii TaxID=2748011 RepID=UPI0015B85BA6|nr:hypothetical protein [Thiomicrorhabdus cannonii]
MTEPVTPKAERRVIDGEVVQDEAENLTDAELDAQAQANARRRAHNRVDHKPQDKPGGEQQEKRKLPIGWIKTLTWGGAAAGVILVLLYTRPDTDWQVEHINQLQSQVAQLHETNQLLVARMEQQKQTLEQQLTAQIDEKLAAALQQPQNQPLVSKGDLEAMQNSWQQQLEVTQQQLEKQLDDFGQQLQQKWQTLGQQIGQQAQQAGEALPSGEEAGAALQQLEQKLQSEITRIGDKLANLFALKETQQSQSATPQTTPQPLSEQQLNAWRIEINAQWLMHGDVQQVQNQLLALEQALGVSETADKTELARKIGQDLTALTQYDARLQQFSRQQQRWIADLQRMIQQLPQPKAAVETSQAQPQAEAETTWQMLLHKLSGLVSVKKREDEQTLSQVDRLWQHDVLLQRLQLWTERLQWALQSGAKADAQNAANEMEQLIAQYFAAQHGAFKAVLDEVRAADITGRQPLLIAAGL